MTLVNVNGTARSRVARTALTVVAVDEIDTLAARRRARRRVALVYVHLARGARVSGRTATLVAVDAVHTRRVVRARL